LSRVRDEERTIKEKHKRSLKISNIKIARKSQNPWRIK